MATKKIYLLGFSCRKLSKRKLPCIRKVLQLFFYKHTNSNLTIRQCFDEVIRDVLKVWKTTGIPVCKPYNAVSKIMKIYREWELLKKNKKKKTQNQKIKEHTFKNRLKNLFDISSRNSIHPLTEAQSQFLNEEWKTSNRHDIFLASVNSEVSTETLVNSDLGNETNNDCTDLSPGLSHASSSILDSTPKSFTSCSVERTDSNYSDELISNSPLEKVDVITPGLVAALDRTNTSDRNAAFILAATVPSMGVKVQDALISSSTIRRRRMEIRGAFAKELKETLQVAENLIVHWDGKILPEVDGIETVDRLPVVVTGLNTEQLLGVPKIDEGTAIKQAMAVVETLDEWNLKDQVKGVCFDTAAVNTGLQNGTCVAIERILGRNLLHLACRHHVFEIILKNVFEVSWPVTRGPEVPIFKRFQKEWRLMNKSNYKIGLQDNKVLEVLGEQVEEIKQYISDQLQMFHPRDDSRELLELAYIFLGGTPPNGIKFKLPGAMHHARWLSKAIYTLKIFMFQTQFLLSRKDIASVRDISIFIVIFYIKAWFEAPSAISAPYNDLKLVQSLIEYKQIQLDIANAALEKLKLHLWYLSEHLISLSFFDERITESIKLKMISAIKHRKSNNTREIRFNVKESDLDTLVQKDLSNFISVESLFLFKQFQLSYGFLDIQPNLWETNQDYIEAKKIFLNLKVVNDVAERGVALITTYNRCLTRNEEQKQFLLQLVQYHRQKFPNCTKTTLASEK